MNDKQTRRTPDKKPGTPYRPFFGILAAGIASYITALCYLPTSGIFSTLPVAALLALAASRFCREKWEIYALMGVMPAVVTTLLGFSPKRAVFVGVACVFQSVFALFAKRAFVTYRKGPCGISQKEPSYRYRRDTALPFLVSCRFRKPDRRTACAGQDHGECERKICRYRFDACHTL